MFFKVLLSSRELSGNIGHLESEEPRLEARLNADWECQIHLLAYIIYDKSQLNAYIVQLYAKCVQLKESTR